MNGEGERGVILPFVLVVCLLITLLMQGMLTLIQQEPSLLQAEMFTLYQKARMQHVVDEYWERLEQSVTPLYKGFGSPRTATGDLLPVPFQHSLNSTIQGVQGEKPLVQRDVVLYREEPHTHKASAMRLFDEAVVHSPDRVRKTPAQYPRSGDAFNEPASALIYWPGDTWCTINHMAVGKKWHCTRFEISAYIGQNSESGTLEELPLLHTQMARLLHVRKLRTGHLRIVQGGVELSRTRAGKTDEKILIPLYWRLLHGDN